VTGVYDGTLNAAKTTITGSWAQNGIEQKLNFKRSDQLLELVRPQNPVKPYPYKEEEISFPNEKAKITLAGTLTLPRGPGPFPSAILISGSGPHDRDESIVGHRPFLVLADYLSRKGIAVLRFDKRGIGKSTGDYAKATTEDFAADTEAALFYLKSRKEIDPNRTGLIGHSEGGLIAPLLASRSGGVAWIVLLAGPGLNGEDALLLQSELVLKSSGVDDDQIAKNTRLQQTNLRAGSPGKKSRRAAGKTDRSRPVQQHERHAPARRSAISTSCGGLAVVPFLSRLRPCPRAAEDHVSGPGPHRRKRYPGPRQGKILPKFKRPSRTAATRIFKPPNYPD